MPKPDPEAFRQHMERVQKERTEAIVSEDRADTERAINQAILNDYAYRKRST